MTEQKTKRAYDAPQLKEFGSVRNLTGGSGASNMMDAGAGMIMV